MNSAEISSIEKGDSIYYPPTGEWWKVVGTYKKHKLFGDKIGAQVVCSSGFMAKLGIIRYNFTTNFFQHGILLKNDNPQTRLVIELKYG